MSIQLLILILILVVLVQVLNQAGKSDSAKLRQELDARELRRMRQELKQSQKRTR